MTEPWGSPHIIEVEDDASSPQLTEKARSARYGRNHARAQPMKPNDVSSRPRKMS